MSHRHEVVGHEVVEPSPAIAQDARAVLRTTLQRIVGADHVLTDPDVTVSYETDWTGRRYSAATAIVRPGSTDEVSAVIAACAGAGVPVIPQGGNTGLVGASVPRAGEVVLSTRRLQRLDPVDLTALQVTVGAGVTLSRLQEHVRAAGLEVGVDFGARDSATAGSGLT
jgi:FAD/FMN-containing dehydrogenase